MSRDRNMKKEELANIEKKTLSQLLGGENLFVKD